MITFATQDEVSRLFKDRLGKRYDKRDGLKIFGIVWKTPILRERYNKAKMGGDLWLWDFLTDLEFNS